MAAKLQRADPGFHAALRDLKLSRESFLARGYFCSVYDNHDGTVTKVSIDSVSFEGHRDHYTSKNLPKMLTNHGIVGEQYQGQLPIYAYTVKKLRPLRAASKPARELARDLTKAIQDAKRYGYCTPRYPANRDYKAKDLFLTRYVLECLSQCPLDDDLQAAFGNLYQMSTNFENLYLDFHNGNLMVDENDRLILNDVICDYAQLIQ
jgi:hypothetical protein